MTTNQTIDGVSRAALEILLSDKGGLAQAAAAHELRALLDAPVEEEERQTLLEVQHELAILHDVFKLYPGAWCCKPAQRTNGWHHHEACKNWVLVD